MGEQTRDRDETGISEFQEKSFQYQLDCLARFPEKIQARD